MFCGGMSDMVGFKNTFSTDFFDWIRQSKNSVENFIRKPDFGFSRKRPVFD